MDDKQIVRTGILLARNSVSQKQIAEAIECSEQHLSQFLKGGNIGDTFVARAKEWLQKNGNWEKAVIAERSENAQDIALVFASKFRWMADVLQGNFPLEFKQAELSAMIDNLAENKDAMIWLLKKNTE